MLRIEKSHANEMIRHAKDECPDECCGILAGRDDKVCHLYRVTNAAKSPYRYLMAPQEFLNADLDAESNGWELLAFYHSHTHSAACLSPTDIRMAVQSGWIDVYYVMVSLEDKADPQIRAFRIDESGVVVEDELQIK